MIMLTKYPYYIKLYVSIEKELTLSFNVITRSFTNRIIKANEQNEFKVNTQLYKKLLIPQLIESELFDVLQIDNCHIFKLTEYGKLKLL